MKQERCVTRCLRRVGVGIAGCLTVLVGVALLVLPGPGVLTIAAGLALLSTEFECARRYMHWCRARGGRLSRYFSREELPPQQRS
ncbi:MAG: PGPGW domain-containing protein [Steroidobacteraceae bacterium]